MGAETGQQKVAPSDDRDIGTAGRVAQPHSTACVMSVWRMEGLCQLRLYLLLLRLLLSQLAFQPGFFLHLQSTSPLRW